MRSVALTQNISNLLSLPGLLVSVDKLEKISTMTKFQPAHSRHARQPRLSVPHLHGSQTPPVMMTPSLRRAATPQHHRSF